MEEESSVGQTGKNSEAVARIYTYIDSMYTHFTRICQGLTILLGEFDKVVKSYSEDCKYEFFDDFGAVTVKMGIIPRYTVEYGIFQGKTPNSSQYFDAISDINSRIVSKFTEIIIYSMIPLYPKNLSDKHKEIFAKSVAEYIKGKIKVFMAGDKKSFIVTVLK